MSRNKISLVRYRATETESEPIPGLQPHSTWSAWTASSLGAAATPWMWKVARRCPARMDPSRAASIQMDATNGARMASRAVFRMPEGQALRASRSTRQKWMEKASNQSKFSQHVAGTFTCSCRRRSDCSGYLVFAGTTDAFSMKASKHVTIHLAGA